MKRGLVVIVVILIGICFSMYILDINPLVSKAPIGFQYNSSEDIIAPETQQAAAIDLDPPAFSSPAEKAFSPEPVEIAPISKVAVTAAPDLPGWELVWNDEFDKPNLDIEYWTRVDRKNNYNGELEYYLPSNITVEDGCLVLTAKKEAISGKKYTSGMVETEGKLSLVYGRVEARIKLPVDQGLFPAFWMLSNGGDEEVDIMEMIGCEPGVIYGVNHYNKYKKKTYGTTVNKTPGEFHVYALEWEKSTLKWFLDGKLFHETTAGVPANEMYIILNLAVGGDWPGPPDKKTVFPAIMMVDYIRIYNRKQ